MREQQADFCLKPPQRGKQSRTAGQLSANKALVLVCVCVFVCARCLALGQPSVQLSASPVLEKLKANIIKRLSKVWKKPSENAEYLL